MNTLNIHPAAELVKLGYQIFPLRGGTKLPQDKGWRTNNYSKFDPAAHHGNCGVRLREREVVLDVDPRNFDPGDDPLARLCKDFGLDLSGGLQVRTAQGGTHIYLLLDDFIELDVKLDDYHGLDIKRFKGYVVAPGSKWTEGKGANGGGYEIIGADTPLLMPDALLGLLRKDGAAPLLDAPAEAPTERADTPDLDTLTELLLAIPVRPFRKNESAWRKLAMGFHSATGGSSEGREILVGWSTADPIYRGFADEIRRRWNSFTADKPGGIKKATFFQECYARIPKGHTARRLLVDRVPAADEDWGDTPTPVAPADIVWQSDFSKIDFHEELVEDLIVQGSLVGLIGQPGGGKSWAAMHLAAAVSRGRDAWGKECMMAPVFYFAAEGASTMKLRLHLLQRPDLVPDARVLHRDGQFFLTEFAPDLSAKAKVDAAVKAIETKKPVRPLVVLDTLARCSAGVDENSFAEVSALLEGADRIRQLTEGTLIIVHHEGKDAGRGPRGHSSIQGTFDTILRAMKTGAKRHHVLKVAKQRCLTSEGAEVFFKLEPTIVGHRLNRARVEKPIWSALIVEIDKGEADGAVAKTTTVVGRIAKWVLSQFPDGELSIARKEVLAAKKEIEDEAFRSQVDRDWVRSVRTTTGLSLDDEFVYRSEELSE